MISFLKKGFSFGEENSKREFFHVSKTFKEGYYNESIFFISFHLYQENKGVSDFENKFQK